MAFYIAFLILEILSVIFGIYMGYHRGLIKATFRFCELAVAAVASLFLAKAAAFAFGSWGVDLVCAMLDKSVRELIFSSENSAAFFSSLVGALFAPIFFAVFFALLKFATLIGFNTMTNAFSKKMGEKKPSSNLSAWGGAGVGVLTSVLVCSVVLSPFFCGLYLVGSVPGEEREDLVSYTGIDSDVACEICRVLPESAPKNPVSLLMAKLATTTTVAGVKYCAIDEVPEMLCMLGDFLSSYENAKKEGKDDISVIGSAISSTIPHMENSAFISEMTSSVLNSVGESIKNGDSVPGNGIGGQDGISKELMNSVGDILTSVSSDNIVDNLEVLVGYPEDENDNGLLGITAALSNEEDVKMFLEEGRAEELAEILIDINENSKLEATMAAVKSVGTAMFAESVLSGASEDEKNACVELIEASVNDIIASTEGESGDFRANIEAAEQIIANVVEGELSEGEIKLLAVFAVHHFCTEEYYKSAKGVNSADIETFLGIN